MSLYFLEATAFARLFVREPGTDALIHLMETVEDNRKLISAASPLEVYAAIRRRERAGQIAPAAAASALELLRVESARMVQQPLNPGVLETARQLLDRTSLRWPEALQLGSALTARDMFPGTAITFVAASPSLLDAARAEGLESLDPSSLVPSSLVPSSLVSSSLDSSSLPGDRAATAQEVEAFKQVD
ncbi:MAG: type II toxin-antitoxin system VapC family toxin [Terracidiphilus sp.]